MVVAVWSRPDVMPESSERYCCLFDDDDADDVDGPATPLLLTPYSSVWLDLSSHVVIDLSE